jgi:Domain of unknown function (DUF4389)
MISPGSYPVDLQLDAGPEIANWRPLVHWILAIPHLFIANVLGNVANVLSVISWFSIVFTGRLPDGIARFQCMILRYEARTYSYLIFPREPYPPFEFEMATTDPGTDPLRLAIAPQLEDRNRLTVGLRLLWMIPILVFAALVFIATAFVVLIAFFAVLFTGRWPAGLRQFAINSSRLMQRVGAYSRLLVDDYPPFALNDSNAR